MRKVVLKLPALSLPPRIITVQYNFHDCITIIANRRKTTKNDTK